MVTHLQLSSLRRMLLSAIIFAGLVLLGAGCIETNPQPKPPAGGFKAGDRVQVSGTGPHELSATPGRSGGDFVVYIIEGERLQVTGEARTVDGAKWYPVRNSGGQNGWVAEKSLKKAN